MHNQAWQQCEEEEVKRTYVDGLIKLFGIPEGVLNAGRSLSAISTAFSLNSCRKCVCMNMHVVVCHFFRCCCKFQAQLHTKCCIPVLAPRGSNSLGNRTRGHEPSSHYNVSSTTATHLISTESIGTK